MFYALEPNSKYEVVVQSKNKWGWSQTSKPFFFSTRATGKHINQDFVWNKKVWKPHSYDGNEFNTMYTAMNLKDNIA